MRTELKDWMKQTGRTPESLSAELKAEGIKASPSLIKAVIQDRRRFGLDTIAVIQRKSRQKVNFNSLYIPCPNQKASRE